MADLVESCFGGDGAYGVVGRLEAPCGFGEAEFGEVLVGRGVQARLEAAAHSVLLMLALAAMSSRVMSSP